MDVGAVSRGAAVRSALAVGYIRVGVLVYMDHRAGASAPWNRRRGERRHSTVGTMGGVWRAVGAGRALECIAADWIAGGWALGHLAEAERDASGAGHRGAGDCGCALRRSDGSVVDSQRAGVPYIRCDALE